MTRYQVDSEAVASTTAGAQASAGRIQAEVTSLIAMLGDLQSTWSGQAASAFQGVVNDWVATQRMVEQNLVSMNTTLGQAGQHYAEIEAQNLRLFAG